mgnify:CR=1 FL=1
MLECEVVLTLGGIRPDGKVHAGFLIVPVRLDGIFWSDSEGKETIGAGALLRRFINLHGTRSPDLVLRAAYDLPEASFSNAIALHGGGIHLLAVHLLGFREHPVVFNNSCSSWADLGAKALHAGARAYICTARPVADGDATAVAIGFVECALRGVPLAEALRTATAGLPTERNPYIYVGLPFSTLKSPPAGVDVTERWRDRVIELRASMAQRLGDDIDEDLRRTLREALAFVDSALQSVA